MSSSLSGKLQKAMRCWRSSGTGGKTCSTSSKGMCEATHFAASSVKEGNSSVGISMNKKVNQHGGLSQIDIMI